jgi:hydrogenase-4 component B
VVLRICGVGLTWTVALAAASLAYWTLTRGVVAFVTLASPIDLLRLDFGATPLATPFLALLAMVSLAVGFWSLRRGRPADIVLVGFFALTMLGVLVAQSVVAFLLAWEAMSLVSAFLVAAHHERRNVRRAALTYLIFAQGGALCILAAMFVLALHTGSASFLAMASAAKTLTSPMRSAALVLALLGFGSKAGFVPMHFWLPRAHPVAPASASALLSGVMLKVAIYGLCLVSFELAAPATLGWGVVLVLLGTVSAIAGVLYAVVDRDLKRLLAYSSIENIGIITIGLGVALIALAIGNAAAAGLALVAALFHAVNHGLFKALLFLGAGAVADSEGTVDLERLGGLWGHLVWTAPFFLIGCVAIAGLPPLNGFSSEWLTFQSLIAALGNSSAPVKFVLVAAVAGLALTGGLAAACFVKVFGVVFLGRARHDTIYPVVRETFDASTFALGFLAALCVMLGLIPLLAVGPLRIVAAATLGIAPLLPPALPVLSLNLAMLPFAGALLVAMLAAARGVRRVPTWTCGSPVTTAAQYTATAFAKPLRTIFAFLLFPERRRVLEFGLSRWFPSRIRYRTESRYVVDEAARRFTAVILRLTRRSRIVQSGSLRLYLAYAMATFILIVLVAR